MTDDEARRIIKTATVKLGIRERMPDVQAGTSGENEAVEAPKK